MEKRPAVMLELTLVALSCAAGAVLVPQLPVLGLPLAGAALAWLAYRFGYVPAVAATVFATGVAVLVYGSLGVAAVVAPALLLAGPGAAWALTRWPAMRVVTVLGLALALLAIVPALVEAALAGTTVSALLRSLMTETVTAAVKSASAQSGGDVAQVKEIGAMLVSYAALLWPSSALLWFGLPAALVVPLVSKAGRTLGRSVNQPPDLPELDLSIHLVWPVIAGLAALAYATSANQTTGIVWAIGANLLLAVRPILFFQGVADFAALYRKAKVGRFGRTLGYALLTFSEIAVPSISVVGLADLFLNLRRLPRAGMPPKGPQDIA